MLSAIRSMVSCLPFLTPATLFSILFCTSKKNIHVEQLFVLVMLLIFLSFPFRHIYFVVCTCCLFIFWQCKLNIFLLPRCSKIYFSFFPVTYIVVSTCVIAYSDNVNLSYFFTPDVQREMQMWPIQGEIFDCNCVKDSEMTIILFSVTRRSRSDECDSLSEWLSNRSYWLDWCDPCEQGYLQKT